MNSGFFLRTRKTQPADWNTPIGQFEGGIAPFFSENTLFCAQINC